MHAVSLCGPGPAVPVICGHGRSYRPCPLGGVPAENRNACVFHHAADPAGGPVRPKTGDSNSCPAFFKQICGFRGKKIDCSGLSHFMAAGNCRKRHGGLAVLDMKDTDVAAA
ncbi:hypothetical protein OFAG_02281 [Oxalobacter formigenes HOxBLS]|uniref:Uncharacterized protein n=1 Tax=Oxalobacter paraformigenes TaxID=556268 RepID=T5LQG8_9BURK|nr:hypothetical protein OFAG_02281 [Oxalobacter paraformigenes]